MHVINKFIGFNINSFLLRPIQPSSPSTKELHGQTGVQQYSDTSPFEVSECSLVWGIPMKDKGKVRYTVTKLGYLYNWSWCYLVFVKLGYSLGFLDTFWLLLAILDTFWLLLAILDSFFGYFEIDLGLLYRSWYQFFVQKKSKYLANVCAIYQSYKVAVPSTNL